MYIYIYICTPSFFSREVSSRGTCTRHASNRGPPPTFCFSTRQQKSIACCSKSLLLRFDSVQPLTVACQLLTTYETEPVPEQTYANVCRVVCNLLARPSLSPPFSFPLFPSRFAHTCDAFPCQGDRGAGSAADFSFLAERRVGRSNQLAEVSRNCRDRFCGGKDAF